MLEQDVLRGVGDDELAGAGAGALLGVVGFEGGRVLRPRLGNILGAVIGEGCRFWRLPRFGVVGGRAGALVVLLLALHEVSVAVLASANVRWDVEEGLQDVVSEVSGFLVGVFGAGDASDDVVRDGGFGGLADGDGGSRGAHDGGADGGDGDDGGGGSSGQYNRNC